MLAELSKIWGRVFAAGILLLVLSSCASQAPIRIGFVAGLTGPNAALGVDGRDGALLAVEKINTEGGVNGRLIELIVRDDLGTSEGSIAADHQLIQNEGMFVIVGHMTSSAMMAAWAEIKDSGVVFLSPTVSTPQLSGIEDNFFRLIPVNSAFAEKLAEYAVNELDQKKVAIFYDIDNAAFTDTLRVGFEKNFISNGGEIVMTYSFSSAAAPNFKPALEYLKSLNPDGIFIIASAFDTALIAQQADLIGLDVQLLTSNWALTDDLIENGGLAVDGIVTVVAHDESNQTPEYLDFSRRYQERFGRSPTFAAGYGFESILTLAAALEKTNGGKDGLTKALLQTNNFTGVNGNISFDKYGDVQRTLYLITVRDGKFFTAKKFPTP